MTRIAPAVQLAAGAAACGPTPLVRDAPIGSGVERVVIDRGDADARVHGIAPEVRYYAVGADGAPIADGRLPTPRAAQLVLTRGGDVLVSSSWSSQWS